MKRTKIWKIFKLPSPSDLGMTEDTNYNSLPMKMFQDANDNSPTWEDWEERVKKEYPIRFFFSEELVPWFSFKYRQWIADPIYWLKCHLLTSHKYHMLDLRQPKGSEGYRFGWIDSDSQMVYALFNILNRFVKYEMTNWYCPSEEEVASDPHLSEQRRAYMEVKAIHYWWNVSHNREEQAYSESLCNWHEAKKVGRVNEQELWTALHKMEEDKKSKMEDMVTRLIKIRHHLWT